jgi:hypothetical protein
MNTICLPSGDQLGLWSSVPELGVSWVSWRTLDPSAFIRNSPTIGGGPFSGMGPMARMNAISRPSGDHSPSSLPRHGGTQPDVRFRRSLPVGATT